MKPYNPLKSYPYSTNRLLVVDWASLAYHQMFSLKSEKRTTQLNLDTVEDELAVFNSHMLRKMLKYIKLFNPKDIVCALEGKNVWRFDFVKEYYGEHAIVYYDTSAFYIRFDNCLYKVSKEGAEYIVTPLDIIDDKFVYDLKNMQLNKLPQATQDIFWDIYLPNGVPMLPKYKGTRGDEWAFNVSKSEWKRHKEQFAVELGKLYRAKCIRVDGAEGDDVIYVTTQYLKNEYDSIILITKDSDFNQLLDQDNLKIYNHLSDEMTECLHPTEYLEIKILQGDSSDNINGIVRPNKRKKLGKTTARTLFEGSTDVYSLAKTEGWDNQYLRNQRLISFRYIPTHIQRTICESIDNYEIGFEGIEILASFGISDKMAQQVLQLKNIGCYTLLDREYVNEHPDIFNPVLFASQEEAEFLAAVKPKRVFQDMTGVFDDPYRLNTQTEIDDEVF